MMHASLQIEIACQSDWFHCIDLGGGICTPGSDGDHSQRKLGMMKMPESLRGKRVLDVGCCEGFFSFDAERRGADRVLAVDTRPAALVRLDICRRALKSKVESLQLNVYDFDAKTMGTFDVVLFLAVFHHLRHPFLALDKLASITSGILLIEVVEAVPLVPAEDALLVRRGGDRGQFKLLPTRSMILLMLQNAGFGATEILGVHRRKPADPSKQLFSYEQQRVMIRATKNA